MWITGLAVGVVIVAIIVTTVVVNRTPKDKWPPSIGNGGTGGATGGRPDELL